MDVVEEEMGFIIESHDSCQRHAGFTSSYLHSPCDEEVSAMQRVESELLWMYPRSAEATTVGTIRRFNPIVMTEMRNIWNSKDRHLSEWSTDCIESEESRMSVNSVVKHNGYYEHMKQSNEYAEDEPNICDDWWWERAQEYGERTLHAYNGPNTVLHFDSAHQNQISDAAAAFDILLQLDNVSKTDEFSGSAYLRGARFTVDSANGISAERERLICELFTI